MEKYRASFAGIKKYQIVKETEKQVVFLDGNGKEKRLAKISGRASWHDTKDEAIEYLINQEKVKISEFNRLIAFCNHTIEKIKNY